MNTFPPYAGKRTLLRCVCRCALLSLIISSLISLSGCKPKPEPQPSPSASSQTRSDTNALSAQSAEDIHQKNVADLMENMSPSERAAFQKLVDQQKDTTLTDATSTVAAVQELPTFFPLNDDLQRIIDDAMRALRMDLPYEEKLKAIEALDGIYNPAILEVVEAALEEANVDIREAALDSIMDLNDPVVIPVVMKALDDEDPDIREYALDAVMDIDDPQLNEVFDKALNDESTDVRENAVDLMLFIESANILPSLAKALNDPDEDIRDIALITLEDIPDKRAIDILLQNGLLNDNEMIREDSMDSLEFIFDREFNNYQEARSWWDANRDAWQFDE